MGGENRDFEISRIIKQLKSRREGNQATVLVLGSRAGGLFRSEMYDTLKLYGEPSFATLSQTEQFAACYRILTHPNQFTLFEIDEIFTQALASAAISEADIYLAALVRLHVFDVVISTNIDDIFERAMEYVGMEKGSDFDIYDQRNIEKANAHHKKRYCKVIKVFGQLAEREYAVKRNAYLNQHELTENLLGRELERDVLVIGLDPTWDEELYHVFHPHGDTFWYVNEERLDDSSAFYKRIRTRNVQQLVGAERNYEDFVTELYWQYVETMPANFVLHGIVLQEMRQMRESIQEYKALASEIRQLKKEFEQLRIRIDTPHQKLSEDEVQDQQENGDE